MRIVGTAGHVDHGKSSLVRSLTGIDPDRWAEERERGMTLDLGFAPLRFSDGVEAGIIDVPGHERFLHNMLAGAGGIDVLLLVVDALEGPRAQTAEHLEILGFLNVSRTIVVITKIDLADDRRREAVRREVEVACRGTVAERAPVVWVSNATLEGLEALRSAIHDALAGLPPPLIDAPAFLPIDRAFTLPGHGTIVTGTLMQGAVERGTTLVLQPAGIPARVRSIEIFGRKSERAVAGARVALNVPGLRAGDVRRGDVLAAANGFEPVTCFSVAFTPLERAAPTMRRRTPVRVHTGAAEIEGLLLLPKKRDRTNAIEATIQLTRPTVTYPGARIIIRRLSPKDLLGGAVAKSTAVAATKEHDAAGDATSADMHPKAAACAAVLEAAGLRPLSAHAVALAANVLEADAASALSALLACGRIAALEKPIEYVSSAVFDASFERVAATLRERQEAAPWRLGCSAGEISAALGISDALGLRLLAAWEADGRVAQRHRWWCLPGFAPALRKDQRAFFDKALRPSADALLAPFSYDVLVREADASKISGIREAFESLVAVGALLRVGDDVYRRSQIERARAVVRHALGNGARATTSGLRIALGLSRKHALPLLEHFDSEGITMREGDVRRLRSAESSVGAPA